MHMYFTRKPSTVIAIQLTEENISKVEEWSRGKLKAGYSSQSDSPPIVVISKTIKDKRYANYDWWLLLREDGSFDVMYETKFKEEYEFLRASTQPVLKSDILKTIGKSMGMEVLEIKPTEADYQDFLGLPKG